MGEAHDHGYALVGFILSIVCLNGLFFLALYVYYKSRQAHNSRCSWWANQLTSEQSATSAHIQGFMEFAGIPRNEDFGCLLEGQQVLEWYLEHTKDEKSEQESKDALHVLKMACNSMERVAHVYAKEERDEDFLKKGARSFVMQHFLVLAPVVACRNTPSVRGIRDACIVIQKNFPKLNKILQEMVESNFMYLSPKDGDLLDQAFRSDSTNSAFLPIRCFAFQKWYLSTKSPAEASFEYQC